ncbi:NAD(P)H-quinone oxidoreductase subunit N, chloroplastic isoform X3 [Camellia sinensis]|uniref:NAD(P)H-quinone oxidoreductase subunit N, chloroplastic isoform X3 n=1 Tax=Camellia sinensis TaxID=4442 RepID=UPI00103680F8|nr:NAD(P)H-quinone oxidoreductase subunit N, chloroplastic isoform X3 [Camellia sinensis]
MAACSYHQCALLPSSVCLQHHHHKSPFFHCTTTLSLTTATTKQGLAGRQRGGGGGYGRRTVVRCGIGIGDFIGGDLVKFDLGRWLSDVEEHKALAIYSPHEGGYEGRYLNRLRYQGYHFLDLSARGLGDPEATLTKIHPVCPVLSKAELQFLALLPSLRPKVRVIAECGNWRKFMWKPLKEIAALPANEGA